MENQGLSVDAELPCSPAQPSRGSPPAVAQADVGGTAGPVGSVCTPWFTPCSSQSPEMRANTMPNPTLKTETEIHLLC